MTDLYAALAAARATVTSIERAIEAAAKTRPTPTEEGYANVDTNGNYTRESFYRDAERNIYDL